MGTGFVGSAVGAMASNCANHVLAAPPMLVTSSSVSNPDRALSVMNKLFFIRAEWDEEAAVWVATSDDVPGLATEAATMEALCDRLSDLAPELLALNGYAVAGEIAYEVLARNYPLQGQSQSPDGQQFHAGSIDARSQIQLLGVNTSFCSTS